MEKEQFLHITEKYLAGTITRQEEKDLLQVIDSSEEYKTLFKQYIEEWIPPVGDIAYGEKWKRLVSNIRPLERPDVKHYSISSYLRIAAVAALLLVGGLTAYWFTHSASGTEEYEWISFVAEEDQTILLPDSSSVHLRKDSRLDYFSDPSVKDRIVRLEGEAFFDVIHKSSQPFYVQTGELSVKVLGTSFSVDNRSFPDHIAVILVDGKVGLLDEQEKEIGLLLPGQMADYSISEHSCTIKEVDSDRMTLWRKGIIVYENAAIDEILHLLSHYYGTGFEWSLPAGKEERFSGAFLKTQPLSTVIEQIEKLTGAKITPTSDE